MELPLDAVVLGGDGRPERMQGSHDRWVVASQNCDLATTDEASPDPAIELRPVFTEAPPAEWGIRSSRLLLTEGAYVESTSPRLNVSAAVLSAALDSNARREDPVRPLAFTTWLGLRYDRPAVPPELVPLAKRIAEEVTRRRNRETARLVRDVLMQFEVGESIRYSVYAVLERTEDRGAVREWLAEVSRAVPVELGVADVIEAAPAAEISFELVETSYAADVSQLTWRGSQPDPDGAT